MIYTLGQQIKDNMKDMACEMYVGEEKVMRGFRGETAANWQFVRLSRRWEDNIKTVCQERRDGVGRIDLLHEIKCVLGHVVRPFERGNETSGSIKCGKCDQVRNH